MLNAFSDPLCLTLCWHNRPEYNNMVSIASQGRGFNELCGECTLVDGHNSPCEFNG